MALKIHYIEDDGERRELLSGEDLCWAALQGDDALVQRCLDAHVSLESTSRDGWTPLLTAAFHGHLRVTQMLASARANLEATSSFGRTPIMCAASGGHKEIVDVLRRLGADLKRADMTGATALTYAQLVGDEGIITSVAGKSKSIKAHSAVESSALKRSGDDGLPLLDAAHWRQIAELRRLLSENASAERVNAVNSVGETALMHAACDVQGVELLLAHGADVHLTNTYGWTALSFAAMHGNVKVAASLLEALADPYSRSHDGRSALDLAREHDHERGVVELLEARYAHDVHEAHSAAARLAELDQTARAQAAQARRRALQLQATAARRKMLERSKEAGRQVAGSVLFDAARDGRVEVLEACTYGGNDADLDGRDSQGSTPLIAAAINGHAGAVRALLEVRLQSLAQAEAAASAFETTTDNATALAVHRKRDEARARLHGMLTASTRNGWTAALWGAHYGHADVLAALIDAGADLETTTPDGRTALDLARHSPMPSHARAVEVLTAALAKTPGQNVGAQSALGDTDLRQHLVRL